MATDIKAWVGERRAIHAAATGGPWSGYGSSTSRGIFAVNLDNRPVVDDMYLMNHDRDAIVDAHNVTVPTALAMVEAVLAVHQPHPSNPLRCAAEYELRPCPTEEAIMDALEGVIDGT